MCDCTGRVSGSPSTPTRRSVRLLAKQLYHDELMELAVTPHGEPVISGSSRKLTRDDSEAVSVHSHFIDSSQLNKADTAARTESKSPLHRQVSEAVRRSPRLKAKQDNLLLESPATAKTNVCPVHKIPQLYISVIDFPTSALLKSLDRLVLYKSVSYDYFGYYYYQAAVSPECHCFSCYWSHKV